MKKIIVLLAISISAICFSQEKIGINEPLPKATLDINGDLIIKKTDQLNGSGLRELFVDKDGLVGVLPEASNEITSKVFYYEADEKALEVINVSAWNNLKTDTNIFLKSKNIIHNTVKAEVVNNELIIGESGYYLVSAAINYSIGAARKNAKIYLLSHIKINGNSISGIRSIFDLDWNIGQGCPVNITSTIQYLNKGDKLTLAMRRTFAGGEEEQGDRVTSLTIQTVNNNKAIIINLQKL